MVNSINIKYQTITSVFVCVLLLYVLGYYLTIDFIKHNYEQACQFVLSAHSLFFIVIGALLYQQKISDKWYNFLIIVSAVVYLQIFYGKYLDAFRMAGDNICQIAYWKILFHQNLAGSIGASFTKPGQLLILGPLYQMSLYAGPLLFSIGVSLVMALCVWSLARIATDIGGRVAGIIAFPVAVYVFLNEFLSVSFSIFLIPSLFAGIWIYFYRPEHRNVGRFLLVLSIQFHIQSVMVLGVVWLLLLVKKDWRELALFSGYSVLSVVFWVAMIYRVQGNMARLNSGAAAGYVAPLEGKPDNGLIYMLDILQDGFVHQPYIRFLTVFGVIGIVGALYYGYKMYLTLFSSIPVLIANVVMLGGDFNLDRYCAGFYAFSCAVGIGTAVRYVADTRHSGSLTNKVCVTVSLLPLIIFSLFIIANHQKEIRTKAVEHYSESDYIVSAKQLVADRVIQDSTGLMTEDDIIYPLVVMNPDRFSSITALQYFNVTSEPARKSILANTDYIWIALNDRHPYYYLSHIPVPAWEKDPFRIMIMEILRTNRSSSLYGYRFFPVERNENRLVVKVQPDGT
jgi:hypothetical protein